MPSVVGDTSMTNSFSQSLTTTQRLNRLEKRVSNLTTMNLPQQILNLQQQIQKLNGQIQVQSHDLKLLNQQLSMS